MRKTNPCDPRNNNSIVMMKERPFKCEVAQLSQTSSRNLALAVQPDLAVIWKRGEQKKAISCKPRTRRRASLSLSLSFSDNDDNKAPTRGQQHREMGGAALTANKRCGFVFSLIKLCGKEDV